MGIGVNQSSSDIRSPYGRLPGQVAGGLYGNLNPLVAGLGFGAQGQRTDRFNQRLAGATGPLADFIRDVRGFAPNVIGQAQSVGNQIAGQGQQSYDQLKSQVQAGLGGASQGLQYAQTAAADAFNPVASRALYQSYAGDATRGAQQSAAGRGLLDSGSAQQAETDIRTKLARDFAMNDQANQQAAIQGLGQAAQVGPQLAGGLMQALPGLQQALQQQYASPLQGAGSLLSLLQSGQSPLLALLGTISPQLGSSSKGTSGPFAG